MHLISSIMKCVREGLASKLYLFTVCLFQCKFYANIGSDICCDHKNHTNWKQIYSITSVNPVALAWITILNQCLLIVELQHRYYTVLLSSIMVLSTHQPVLQLWPHECLSHLETAQVAPAPSHLFPQLYQYSSLLENWVRPLIWLRKIKPFQDKPVHRVTLHTSSQLRRCYRTNLTRTIYVWHYMKKSLFARVY